MQNGNMQANQRVLIIDKERVEVDAVLGVSGLDEEGALLETAQGLIGIDGSSLKIENLEKSSGKVVLVGNIKGVYYIEKAQKKRGRNAIK